MAASCHVSLSPGPHSSPRPSGVPIVLWQPAQLKASSRLRRPNVDYRPFLGSTAVVGLMLSETSYAYVDPATGSMILQGLLAGIAIAIGVMRGYWERLKGFFLRSPQPAEGETSQGRGSGREGSNHQSRS